MLALATADLDSEQLAELRFEQEHAWFYLTCYAIAFLILPIAYLALCWLMRQRLTNPPYLPYFFIFGTFGGMVLMTVMSMNTMFMFAFMPIFLLCSGASLIFTLVSSLRARPRSTFHRTASWLSGLMLSSPILIGLLAAAYQWIR